MANFMVLLFLCTVAMSAGAAKPSIVFESSHQVILSPFTENLTMHCSINNTDLSSDLRQVMSIVVTRDKGEHVAIVTEYDAAKPVGDLSSLNVTGEISTHGNVQGYLDLRWEHPEQEQSANYTCRINVLHNLGHSVVFAKSVYVDFRSTSMNDLIHYIRDLIVETKEREDNMMEALKEALYQKELQITNLTTETKEALKEKDQQIMTINGTLHQMQTRLNALKHTENGTLDCRRSYSPNWPGREGDYMYKDMDYQFASPYTTPPVVHIGVINFRNLRYDGSSGYDTDFVVELVDVSVTGFTMRCKTLYPSSYNNKINKLSANWLSVAR